MQLLIGARHHYGSYLYTNFEDSPAIQNRWNPPILVYRSASSCGGWANSKNFKRVFVGCSLTAKQRHILCSQTVVSWGYALSSQLWSLQFHRQCHYRPTRAAYLGIYWPQMERSGAGLRCGLGAYEYHYHFFAVEWPGNSVAFETGTVTDRPLGTTIASHFNHSKKDCCSLIYFKKYLNYY